MSLNSARTDQLIAQGERVVVDNSGNGLDVLVFDVHEVINGVFFRASKANAEYDLVQSKSHAVQQLFVHPFTNRNLLRFSELNVTMGPYMGTVYGEYFTHASFRRHCKNQVFQNLQPKLRELGIVKRASSLTDILIPFLLAEIAFALFVFDTGSYERTYGLELEMEIITDIKAGKYPSFGGFLKHDVPHVKYG